MNRLIVLIISVILFSCGKEQEISSFREMSEARYITPSMFLPAPDHIIVVWFENKGYSLIVGSPDAPFMNSLVTQGTLFTNAHAMGHPSYPEYVRFFSGTRNGIFSDDCISGQPFSGPNLYTALDEAGKSFAWYSEDLPHTGSDTCKYADYREKHNPVTVFSNVPSTQNKRFADFPTTPSGWATMEDVVCISPNLMNDMHNGTIREGDDWLRQHFETLIDWCKTNNSVFIVYFDEDHGTSNNRIPVIMVGEPVKVNYQSNEFYDHYNFSRTLLTLNGAAKFANLVSRRDVGDCWR